MTSTVHAISLGYTVFALESGMSGGKQSYGWPEWLASKAEKGDNSIWPLIRRYALPPNYGDTRDYEGYKEKAPLADDVEPLTELFVDALAKAPEGTRDKQILREVVFTTQDAPGKVEAKEIMRAGGVVFSDRLR